jgi:DNA adenine methylase
MKNKMKNKIDSSKLKIRPIFNYIGGKSWLREELRNQFNFMHISRNMSNINTYIEPFCGGLGAFINVYDILLSMGIKKVILNDINSHLINFYNVMLFNKNDLLKSYMIIENEFLTTIPERAKKLNKTKDKAEIKALLINSERYFRKIKSLFNETNDKTLNENEKIIKSAQLLFLQNHCYNAVYRENSKGEYNTPFNWDHKTYKIENIEKKLNDLLLVLSLFNEVKFTNITFKDIEHNCCELIYCDPPYINEKEGENKYNQSGFNKEDQILLIEKISPYQFIYSNHKNDLLVNEFEKHTQFLIKEVKRKNIMSSKNASRSEDKTEILVVKFN